MALRGGWAQWRVEGPGGGWSFASARCVSVVSPPARLVFAHGAGPQTPLCCQHVQITPDAHRALRSVCFLEVWLVPRPALGWGVAARGAALCHSVKTPAASSRRSVFGCAEFTANALSPCFLRANVTGGFVWSKGRAAGLVVHNCP